MNLIETVIREHCKFWTQRQDFTDRPHGYFQQLEREVFAQGGYILHYQEDMRGCGVAVAAFASSGLRVFKTNGREIYRLTADISWEVLEIAKKQFEEQR